VSKFFGIAAISLLAVACGGGGGGGGIRCSFMTAGVQECYGYSGLDSAQNTAEKDACTAESGTIVDSCPTGFVGCCAETTSGTKFTTTECYYTGTASDLMTACTGAGGTWSTTD
jgi:hypothetical protein